MKTFSLHRAWPILGICALLTSLWFLTGCTYSIIPDASLRKLDSIPSTTYQSAAEARATAAEYEKRAAQHDTLGDAPVAHGWRAAAVEANKSAALLEKAGDGVLDVTKAAKPVPVAIGQGVQAVAPFVPPVGGVPWGELLGIGGGLLVSAYGVKKHVDEKKAKKQLNFSEIADAWEEAVCSDPAFGGDGSINYNDPNVRAKAFKDVAEGILPKEALKFIYPNG